MTDYSNLKNKTIFDFCKDEKLIFEITKLQKGQFLSQVQKYPLLNVHTLIMFAEQTNNNELIEAIKNQFPKECNQEKDIERVRPNSDMRKWWYLQGNVWLWIAFELVSSSYWKQLPSSNHSGEICCELLSNLYLRHIENNKRLSAEPTAAVVNCFRTCIFVILKTTYVLFVCRSGQLWIAFELVSSSYWKQLMRSAWWLQVCCELLSNLYLRHIENNILASKKLQALLWIAFELVSSSYWKQPLTNECHFFFSCELLSNLYLRHIENNTKFKLGVPVAVVNCFRTCIFVILKTTIDVVSKNPATLWIAFELVSSSYWKQQFFYKVIPNTCCELLSNLYLRHIENNCVRPSSIFWEVVNCFRTCIFVILKTTNISNIVTWFSCELLSNLYLRHIENNDSRSRLNEVKLWIAFELVSSSYWKQLVVPLKIPFISCELLSNLYLRHIENNALKAKDWSAKLWIAFELVSSSYWKQR